MKMTERKTPIEQERIIVVIDTQRGYNRDYRGLFSKIVSALTRSSGEEVFSEGNLPSDERENEKRYRRYFVNSGKLEITVNLEKKNDYEIAGNIKILGREKLQIRSLASNLIKTLSDEDVMIFCNANASEGMYEDEEIEESGEILEEK